MRTARLETVRASVLVVTTRCHSQGGLQMNKGGEPTVLYPMMHSMLPTSPHLWIDRRLWKYYLPATLFAGGNNTDSIWLTIHKISTNVYWIT